MAAAGAIVVAAGLPGHAGAARATNCASSPVQLVGNSTQLILVTAKPSSTDALLTLWRRSGGCWTASAGPWTARIGRNGLSANHREGDGTTPTGTYGFEPVLYGVAPNPGVRYRYHQLVCGDWWDEDPSSPAYNLFQHVACGTRPAFGEGSEALWQETTAYRYFAALTYNVDPVVPGRGSAIFLHADIGGPTNGCISLPAGELLHVLRWLNPALDPQIAIVAKA